MDLVSASVWTDTLGGVRILAVSPKWSETRCRSCHSWIFHVDFMGASFAYQRAADRDFPRLCIASSDGNCDVFCVPVQRSFAARGRHRNCLVFSGWTGDH